MIIPSITAARFPAPEFDAYQVPQMNLETQVDDFILVRVVFILIFLIISGLGFYRFRSRKAMLMITFLGLMVFGYGFLACPCPVGLFQNILDSAINKSPISVGILLLFAIPLTCALFWGRLFCSGACPIGALQEIFHLKTIHIASGVDRALRLLPVVLLILFSVFAAMGAFYPLCNYDPYLPLFVLNFKMPFAMVTLIFILVGLFISRPFCRYFCPYGVLLRLFAAFSSKKPQITTEQCINCRLCEQGCPNNAILIPQAEDTEKSHNEGVRRISLLISCVPLVLCLGGFIGYGSGEIVAAYHPDVILMQDIRSNIINDRTEAFQMSGRTMNSLQTSVKRVEVIVQIGMTFGGLLFALVLMLELISMARHRGNKSDYEIDSGLCFCCGRCYQACPLEKSKDTEQICETKD